MVTIKTINDYYDELQKLFPTVCRQDIKKACSYGWKLLYLLNSYGGDTLIQTPDLWCFIGNLTKDSVKHFHYYIKKLTIKLRVMFKRKKIEWNGCYYFAMSDSLYENYLSQKNKKGRPKKIFNYGELFMYKLYDECRIREHCRKYIFQVTNCKDRGFRWYEKEFICGTASLYKILEPRKFADILVNNYKYEFL